MEGFTRLHCALMVSKNTKTTFSPPTNSKYIPPLRPNQPFPRCYFSYPYTIPLSVPPTTMLTYAAYLLIQLCSPI